MKICPSWISTVSPGSPMMRLIKALFRHPGIGEDNDIEPFRFAKYINKPVSENTVSGHDRILHRTGRNFRIYKDKTVDAKGNDNCDCR